MVLPFWYRLTWVVPEKRVIKRVCVCVAVVTVARCHPTNSIKALKKHKALTPTSGLASLFCHPPQDSF